MTLPPLPPPRSLLSFFVYQPVLQCVRAILSPCSHRSVAPGTSVARQGVMVPPKSSCNVSSQPQGWEHTSKAFPSTAATAFSSSSIDGSSLLANGAAGGVGAGAGTGAGGKSSFIAGGRRSGSWGGVSSLDREFHVILKAGVDVYKHCCKFWLFSLVLMYSWLFTSGRVGMCFVYHIYVMSGCYRLYEVQLKRVFFFCFFFSIINIARTFF